MQINSQHPQGIASSENIPLSDRRSSEFSGSFKNNLTNLKLQLSLVKLIIGLIQELISRPSDSNEQTEPLEQPENKNPDVDVAIGTSGVGTDDGQTVAENNNEGNTDQEENNDSQPLAKRANNDTPLAKRNTVDSLIDHDQPVARKIANSEFNEYIDPNDPGATADWLTASHGDTITVTDDASFSNALSTAQPGDIIQLQSGTYTMQDISLSGSEGNPITIESAPGHWATFDGEKGGGRINITGSWLNFRNFEVQNGTTGSLYTEQAHHNLYEGLKIHNNNRGFDLTNGSHHHLIRNSESYHNFDQSNHGEDGDGFGIWSEGEFNAPIGEGVILDHNIAWGNADDGIDLWMSESKVTLRNNIVRNNGFNVINDSDFVGNGNGFKLGPNGKGHILIGNIAEENPSNGFDYNGGTDSHYLKGNSATNNGTDYNVPNHTVFEDNT